MKCPRCQAETSGRFCGFCGSALEDRRCSACMAEVPAGYQFCSECGAEQGDSRVPAATGAMRGDAGRARAGQRDRIPLEAGAGARGPSPSSSTALWIGGAIVIALAVLVLPYVFSGSSPEGTAARVPVTGASAGGAGAVDLSSMTPREAADRLFNRVMSALSAGDDAEVQSFLPMAIDAYRLVPALDADGHFHLSLLHQTAGDHESGLETARTALSANPDHLLLLFAAGASARELGDSESARTYFDHILEIYETESARGLPEYQEHSGFLPTIREEARLFVAGG